MSWVDRASDDTCVQGATESRSGWHMLHMRARLPHFQVREEHSQHPWCEWRLAGGKVVQEAAVTPQACVLNQHSRGFSRGIQPTYRTGITCPYTPSTPTASCHPTPPPCRSFLTVTTRWELWAGKSWSVLMSHWNMTQYTEVFYIYSLLEMLERQYNENTANKSSVFLLIWQ